MKIDDFFVIPETDEEEKFVDEEIDFLLDVSIKKRDEIKDKTTYADLVRDCFNKWQNNEACVISL